MNSDLSETRTRPTTKMPFLGRTLDRGPTNRYSILDIQLLASAQEKIKKGQAMFQWSVFRGCPFITLFNFFCELPIRDITAIKLIHIKLNWLFYDG